MDITYANAKQCAKQWKSKIKMQMKRGRPANLTPPPNRRVETPIFKFAVDHNGEVYTNLMKVPARNCRGGPRAGRHFQLCEEAEG